MAKTKFNWSLLDRESIASFLLAQAPILANQQISVSDFHKIITRELKKVLPIRVRKNRNLKVDDRSVWVGGTYYSDWDKEKRKCIEIIFEYPLFEDNVKLVTRKYRSFCYTVADTILHELIHMRQFRRRNFKILPDYASNAEKTELRQEQSYLGCSDEIDAYSFNIACELTDRFGTNRKAIVNYLNENQKGTNRRHNSWRMYLKAFQHDHNHPIIRRVKSKVVRYLPQASIGKPYRNKDWIDR